MNDEQRQQWIQKMRQEMADSAHDQGHVFRVLGNAMKIAQGQDGVNMAVLTAAAILHDVGRPRQNQNPALDHAREGAAMAYDYLLAQGHEEGFCAHVRNCIQTHRYRSDAPPVSIEAKILFDADKLDVCGAIGIARTLLYDGFHGHPLAGHDQDGKPQRHIHGEETYFSEAEGKLTRVYDGFFTARAKELAQRRRAIFDAYNQALWEEMNEC